MRQVVAVLKALQQRTLRQCWANLKAGANGRATPEQLLALKAQQIADSMQGWPADKKLAALTVMPWDEMIAVAAALPPPAAASVLLLMKKEGGPLDRVLDALPLVARLHIERVMQALSFEERYRHAAVSHPTVHTPI